LKEAHGKKLAPFVKISRTRISTDVKGRTGIVQLDYIVDVYECVCNGLINDPNANTRESIFGDPSSKERPTRGLVQFDMGKEEEGGREGEILFWHYYGMQKRRLHQKVLMEEIREGNVESCQTTFA